MITANCDGDIVVYRACFACEKNKYKLVVGRPDLEHGDRTVPFEMVFDSRKDLKRFIEEEQLEEYDIETTSAIEPLEFALGNINNVLEKIKAHLQPDSMVVYLTGHGNYRYDIAETAPYKGNRDKSKRPHWLSEARDYIVKNWNGVVVTGCEADDALGIAQKEHTILCSTDKDLDQIPGMHYNFVNEVQYYIPVSDAERHFYMQMLTGDKQSDNIIGIEGVGPVTAAKILKGNPDETFISWEVNAKAAYQKAFGDKWNDRWIENYYLLRICRSDADFQRATDQAAACRAAKEQERRGAPYENSSA